jgi:hypothetical protein
MGSQTMTIHQIHNTLTMLGVPVDFVHQNKDGSVDIAYLPGVSDAQRRLGQQMINGDYDAEAEAARRAALAALPTTEQIEATKTVKDLQAMALALREFIDEREQ